MEDLRRLRDKIDKIDASIVDLFEQRMELTARVAEYKIGMGKAVFDRERELAKLTSVADMAHTNFNRQGVRELFEHIMSVSRKQQYQILTEHGKFAPIGFTEAAELDFSHAAAACVAESEGAARKFFQEGCGLLLCGSWRDACDALRAVEADYAFLPVQDPVSGYVSSNYNLLAEYGFYILEEYRVSADRQDRYMLIARDRIILRGADKISLCFEAPDECGTLYHLVSHLTYNDLNMNRIESIVICKDPLDYRFFIDLSGNINDSAIKNAIHGLQDESRNFRILGNYR